jgi:hypothetical protein
MPVLMDLTGRVNPSDGQETISGGGGGEVR